MDKITTILKILEALTATAGAAGVPETALAAALLKSVEELISAESALNGKTREEIAANTQVQGAQDLLDLLADEAKGE
jgi:hypothetical protein